MELKGRLGLIAQKVPQCSIVSDIGTDHAYIPVNLVQNRICSRAIAVDVKQGPLLAAREHIKQYKLEDAIETRLGDGLEPINMVESDVIVIAGMGGILIKDILLKSLEKAKAARILVLQPMNAIEILREWLYRHGFQMIDEELTEEGEKIYNVLVVKWTGVVNHPEDIYYYIGKKLVEKRDPLLHRLLSKKLRQAEGILEELKNTCEENSETRKKYLYLRQNYIELMNQSV